MGFGERFVEELDMAEEEKSNARSVGWCFMLREDSKVDEICKKLRRWGGGVERGFQQDLISRRRGRRYTTGSIAYTKNLFLPPSFYLCFSFSPRSKFSLPSSVQISDTN